MNKTLETACNNLLTGIYSQLLTLQKTYKDEEIRQSFLDLEDINISYISPDGSDVNIGNSESPWKTFTYAMTQLKPGDTLVFKDGVYKETLNVSVSGIEGNPITITAENDGMAVVDGENVRVPFVIDQYPNRVHDVNVEGIVFKNSNYHVLRISHVDRLTLKRGSGYGAALSGNSHIFSFNDITDSLLEDLSSGGSGRNNYLIYKSRNVIARRLWGLWQRYDTPSDGPNAFMQVYGSSDVLVENCIGAVDPSLID